MWSFFTIIILILCKHFSNLYFFQSVEFLLFSIFCCQVLEGVIKYRWNVLPVEQRDGIKNYVSDVIVQVLYPICFQKSSYHPSAFHFEKILYS